MSEEEEKAFYEKEIQASLGVVKPEDNFVCLFCTFESNNPVETLFHLEKAHNFVFQNIRKIPLLSTYLKHWQIHAPPIVEFTRNGKKFNSIDFSSKEDIDVRTNLHQMRLENIMSEHEFERTTIQKEIPCLFCQSKFTGTWHEYLQWLFEEHQFNPGRPSNLVFIPYLIEYLKNQLDNNYCIFCGSQLPNQRTLRSHMRKKKHMKISNDPLFDKFYMINYLELDGPPPKDDDDDDNGVMENFEDASKDFSETEVNETQCLICDDVFNSPEDCVWHMKADHGFDIGFIRRAYKGDFYNCVRFINYVRYNKNQGICFVCGEPVTGNYAEHYMSHREKMPIKTPQLEGEDQLLIPVIEGDPLLTDLEEDPEP